MRVKILHALILPVALFFSCVLDAQPWMKFPALKKAADIPVTFYDIQRSFNAYMTETSGEEGVPEEVEGWEQFKRWEFFMEPRVYPEGDPDLPSIYPQILYLNSLTSLPSNWESLGPNIVPKVIFKKDKSGAGRVNTIAFHPTNAGIMWIGAPSGGIWKTVNGGLTWKTTSDELASIGISDIVVNPLNPNVIYAVTGDGDAGDTYSIGIVKSFDGGDTWNQTGIMMDISDRVYFRKIIINPQDTATLLATSNKGIYRTSDGFKSGGVVRQGSFRDIESKPGSFNTIYATSYDASGNAHIYKSTNAGLQFTLLTGEPDFSGGVTRVELAVTPANPSVVYALASSSVDDGFFGLYRTSDNGQKWTTLYDRNDPLNLLGWELSGHDEGGQGWYDLSLAVSPNNENIVLTGGVNIWKSIDGGKSFKISAHWVGSPGVPYVHADHHLLRYNPLNQRLYSCNDGGVYYSPDNGTAWNDLSDGLTILQIYRTAATDAVFDLFLTGNQDNGSMMRSDGTWQQVTGGDGMECAIDPSNSDVLYTSYYNGNFYKSIDRGKDFVPLGPPDQPGSGAWITPFGLGNRSPGSLYAAYSEIYKSPDAGNNWLNLSENLTGGTNLRSMAIAPSDNNTIYAATYTKIWISRNGGVSWDEITPGLPQQAIMSIEVSPGNPEHVWIALSGFANGEKVYRSSDGGTTWENYSGGLPNIPCNVIRYRDNSDDALYLGADIGIFYRDNTMGSWQPFTNGLPNVIINDLEIQYSSSRLIAGSYGRGLWASSLYTPPTPHMYAYIFAEGRNKCQGESAKFSLRTIDSPDSVVWNFNGEKTISVTSANPVSTSFSNPGMKNISATVYKGGKNYTARLDHYLNVVSSPEVNAVVYGSSSFHKGDYATLLASGAESYSWDPATTLSYSDSAMTLASPATTTKYVVTGKLGTCQASDTVSIEVLGGPVNDDICSAISLKPGLNGPFTNVGASVQAGEPLPDTTDCNTQFSWCNEGGLQNSVWFSFKATTSTSSFVTSGFDTQIALYSADACQSLLNGSDTLIAANDDFFGDTQHYAAAINEAPLQAGKRYWIQVDGSAGGEEGNFYINIYDQPVSTAGSDIQAPRAILYPNPGNGEFTLETTGITGKITVRIISLTGAVVMENTYNSPGILSEKFNIPQKGVYIVSISGRSDHLIRRLIVE